MPDIRMMPYTMMTKTMMTTPTPTGSKPVGIPVPTPSIQTVPNVRMGHRKNAYRKRSVRIMANRINTQR